MRIGVFSEYVDAKVKAEVEVQVKAQVDAQVKAMEDMLLRQILKMILGNVRDYHMSFEKAMAKADLLPDLEEKVRNLYAAGAQ